MDTLEKQIKDVIITSLNLEDMTADDIDTDAPLFGEGLGLDSIDALELGLAIKNTFHVALNGPSEDVKEHFRSVASLAAFIRANKGE